MLGAYIAHVVRGTSGDLRISDGTGFHAERLFAGAWKEKSKQKERLVE